MGAEDVLRGMLMYFVLPLWLVAGFEATAIWDVRYATATREVSSTEQHVHSVLEMLPLAALLLGLRYRDRQKQE